MSTTLTALLVRARIQILIRIVRSYYGTVPKIHITSKQLNILTAKYAVVFVFMNRYSTNLDFIVFSFILSVRVHVSLIVF